MGWSSAGGAQPAYARSGSLVRGIVFLARFAARPAGGSDPSVSGVDFLSRGPVSMGVLNFDGPDPEPDPAASHLSPAAVGLKARHSPVGIGWSSRVAAGERDRT